MFTPFLLMSSASQPVGSLVRLINTEILVGENCTISGSVITLTGALPGARTFQSAYPDNSVNIPVKIEELDIFGNVLHWEYRTCTFDTTLTGNLNLSSNSNSAVVWGAGSKRAFVFHPSKSYLEYTQTIPSTVWTISHGMGLLPKYKIVDAFGLEVMPPGVLHNLPDKTIMTLTWFEPQAGTVEMEFN